jgi:hypothetical protein
MAISLGFGGNKQSGTTSGSSTQNPWEQQSPFLQQGFDWASQNYQNASQPNQNMQQGWGAQLGAMDTMGNIAQGAAQSNQFLMSPDQLNPESNPYLAANLGVLQDQAQQGFQRQLAEIDRGAAGSGMFGGARQGVAQGLAAEGVTNALAGNTANMLMQNYQQGTNNMLGAQQMANQIQMGQTMPGQVQAGIGMQEQQVPQQALQNYWNVVGGNNWGGTTDFTQNQSSQGTNWGFGFDGSQMLGGEGGGGGGVGGLAGMFGG